jgi:CheY-like chemotaxis protein
MPKKNADTVNNIKILVIEDEGIVAMDLAIRLRCLGYSVPAIVASGEEAIRETAKIAPDIVLMDIRLKGEVDGIEAATEIRARFDVPIIYLTAMADGTTMQRAKATNPCGYITKPFQESDLQSAIEKALRHKSQHRDEKKRDAGARLPD